MSLMTALSGLLIAQDGLSVTGNDLANATTVGFKAGSSIFSDLYPGSSANVPGDGVTEQEIQQDFSQGTLQTTNDPYNLAVQGNGLFVVQKDGQDYYTRDGAFQLSASGELETASGNKVLGYGVNANGTSNGILNPITVPPTSQASKATSAVSLSAALNTADPVITAAFNAGSSTTYDEFDLGRCVQLARQCQPCPALLPAECGVRQRLGDQAGHLDGLCAAAECERQRHWHPHRPDDADIHRERRAPVRRLRQPQRELGQRCCALDRRLQLRRHDARRAVLRGRWAHQQRLRARPVHGGDDQRYRPGPGRGTATARRRRSAMSRSPPSSTIRA